MQYFSTLFYPVSTIVNPTTTNFTVVTGIATASSEVLALNINRKYLLFLNNSTSVMYINFGSSATADTFNLQGRSGIIFENNLIPSNSLHVLSSTSGQGYYILWA